MAIIYSYPITTLPQNSDLFIISRVPGNPDEISNLSVTADVLATFVTARVNLNLLGDTGTGVVNLDTQTLSIIGTTNEIETSASNQTLQIGLPDNVTITNNLTVGNNVQIDTLTNNYIPVNNNSGVLSDSNLFQEALAGSGFGAIGLNTTLLSNNYGEFPDFRVASRQDNDLAVLDLFRRDNNVLAGENVGMLQYSIQDDGQYAVAQIGVETLTTTGTGDSGGGKFLFKTAKGGGSGPGLNTPESRFTLDYNSADFSVPVNITSTTQSSFAGQVTIPLTPIQNTDAASKGYVDSQSGVGGSGTANYLTRWTGTETLGNSGFYQVSAPSTADRAIGLNTTLLDSFYGEYPDFRVASRSLNDPGVLDLFRPDGDVQAGDRVGILQYSLNDDAQYAVAQIEVKTIGNSGTGNTGGGKLCIKTSSNQSGAQVAERLCIDNTEANFSVPINVTNANRSSFAGQVTIPLTPIADTDAASKGYVDTQMQTGLAYLIPQLLTASDLGTGTIDPNYNLVLLSWTGGNGIYTLNLPLAGTNTNRLIRITTDGSLASGAGDKINITATGGETIDGNPFFQISKQYEGLAVFSTGTEWIIVQAKAH